MPKETSKRMYDRIISVLTKEECTEVLSSHNLLVMKPEAIPLKDMKWMMFKYRHTIVNTVLDIVRHKFSEGL